MERPHLRVLRTIEPDSSSPSFTEMLNDHQTILQGYLDTHITRNHSDRTIEAESRFLRGWFEGFLIRDDNYPEGERQLFIWEAMAPVRGRQRIVDFCKGLVSSDLKLRTIHSYMGFLRRLFEYVLESPYIPGDEVVSIIAKYGRIEQPVLEYDYPVHVVDQEEEGFVLTGGHLLDFYDFVRSKYIPSKQKQLPVSRDYTMIVLAGESGLRAEEILSLDALAPHRDLFYEQNRIQTRHGKATKGSGKRVRKTIFTPFAQATMHIYEDKIRPVFPNAKTNPALFLTEEGNRVKYKGMWRSLDEIAEAARKEGLDMPPNFGWHNLRKSFATNYMEQHPDRVWVLMDMMGHINPSTLHRYIKHGRAYFERAIDDYYEELISSASETKEVM